MERSVNFRLKFARAKFPFCGIRMGRFSLIGCILITDVLRGGIYFVAEGWSA